MSDVDNIICAIVPHRYYEGNAAEIREYKSLIISEGLDAGIKKANPKPVREQKLIYDSTTETLEPVYFWILDFMNNIFGGKVEKLVDNFASSPGSGHFSELQGKSSQMQQEASRILGTVNNILKGILNLIYDLKEFQIRLSHYDAANSKDEIKREAGLIALKQMWMDKVDIQRGVGSINALTSGDLSFVTLRDAFLSAKSVEQIDKMDLNERVKRILKPRLQEFFEWKTRSENELKKRFEIEKTYLKSQVSALRLNSRWAKPYLKAAQQLISSEALGSNAALVTAFNTILLQLTIMGTGKIDVKDAAIAGDLPKEFKKIKGVRQYSPIVIVDFNFRGIPSKAGQHYTFGGRAEVTFKAYALNDDELKLLKEKLKDSDINDAFQLIEGMTKDSLDQLKLDLKELLGEEEEEKKVPEEINPFSALFSFSSSKKNKEEEKKKEDAKMEKMKKEGAPSENYAEKYIRNFAEVEAINKCFVVYDVYKKSHGMASFPYGGTPDSAIAPQTAADKFMGFK